MQSAALLAAENRELRAANKKQKRKRERYYMYIGQNNTLTVKKGVNCVRRVNKEKREIEIVSKE
jgi:hypothetical protein